MNKRGNILDIVLTPTFVTVVALGFVGLTILNAIYGVTSSDEYSGRFYSADVALKIKALYGVPKDVNVFSQYELPEGFGIDVSPNTVMVTASDETRHRFTFEEDVLYDFNHGMFANASFVMFKSGNEMGVSANEPNLNAIYCEPKAYPRLAVDIRRVAVGSTTEQLVSGGASVFAKLTEGDMVKLYVYPSEESEYLACLVSQEVAKRLDVVTAIIPINLALSAGEKPLLLASSPSVLIEAGVVPTGQNKAAL